MVADWPGGGQGQNFDLMILVKNTRKRSARSTMVRFHFQLRSTISTPIFGHGTDQVLTLVSVILLELRRIPSELRSYVERGPASTIIGDGMETLGY